METTQPIPDETQAFRRCVRELAALSTLSAVWGRSDPREIAEALGLVLSRSLPVAFVYVRVCGQAGVAVEVARTRRGPTPANQAQEIGKALEPLLKPGSPDQASTIANPFGGGTLRLAIIPIGCEGDCGGLAVGSQQADFPGQTDRLLLGVAANQAAVVLQQKRMEGQLRRSERELADFFDNATLGLHWVGPDGTILRVNQAELNLLGYPREEYVGHHIAEFHADRDVIGDILRRLQAVEELEDYEARLRCKDGSIKHVVISSNVLREDGAFIRTRCFTRDITEQKRAEEALRESEQRFARFMDNLPGLAWIKDLQGRYVYANTAAARAFRTPRADLYGKTDEEVFAPETAVQFKENDQRALASEAGVQVVETLEHADGVLHHSIASKFPIPGPDGRAALVGGMAIDITDRKRAEEALRESEEQFRAVFEQTTGGIAQTDLAGRFVLVNDRYCQIVGRSREELLGLRMQDITHPEDLPENTAQFVALAEGRGPNFVVEKRYVRPDGSHVWVQNQVSAIHDAQGKVRSIAAAVTDITKRKRAEELLTAEKKVLEQIATGRPLPDVLDTLMRQIEALSRDGMLCSALLADEAGQRLVHGAAPSLPEAYNRAVDGIRIGPGVGSCGTAAFERRPVFVTDVAADPLWSDFKELAAAHGLGSCCSTPILSGDGRLLGTIAMYYRRPHEPGAHDRELIAHATHLAAIVIERKRAEEALRRSQEALQEADRRKDEFLAQLAHELRNPLAPVRNAVQVLRLKGPDEPEVRWSRDVIERQVEHLTRLIDDLLDVSRITRNKLELRRQRVELAEVIQGAVESSRPNIEQCGHELTVTLPPEPVYLNADLVRLAQAFLNLLNNAAKYTERGGRIWLTAEVVRGQGSGVRGQGSAGTGTAWCLSDP